MSDVLTAPRRDRACRCRTTRPSGCASGRGRKNAFPAAGRISPDYYCMDGTIPRKHLGAMLTAHRPDGAEVPAALHERVPRGRRQPASADPVRCRTMPDELAPRRSCSAPTSCELCVAVGGTVTGEHGVGIEKINPMCVQFTPQELRGVLRASSAPSMRRRLLNPGKAIPSAVTAAPSSAACMARWARAAAVPDLPRF
jgi:glycolate oxidase